MSKKRARIHPAVAVSAILGLVLMAAIAKTVSHEPLTEFEIFIAGIIGGIAGVKVRHKLPVT